MVWLNKLLRSLSRTAAIKRFTCATCVLCSVICTNALADDNADSIFDLSIEELLNMTVSTVSRSNESLHDTPATVIVITREMIRRRGYKELSEIFDDLPGMELIRPYGDTWISQYWRGSNQLGGTMLLMIDGTVMNHLYFDSTFVLSAFALSNIKQIEIVLGPAAVAYGDNAFMGTINVITLSSIQTSTEPSTKPSTEPSSAFNGFVTTGSNQRRIVDFHQSVNLNEWHFNLAARLDKGNLDDSHLQSYQYTQDRYYNDPRLWGDFINHPKLANNNRSPHNNQSLDLRLAYQSTKQSTQLAMQYFKIESGYGNVYAADKALNAGSWIRPDSSVSLRHLHDLSEHLKSTTLLRYRRSDIDKDSLFVEAFPWDGVPGGRLMDASYWRSINRSTAFYQDFDYQLDNWRSAFGFRYEQKSLQKAYDISRGENPFIPPSLLQDWRDYDFPVPPVASSIADNRAKVTEKSLYWMINRRFSAPLGWGDEHLINAGLRYEKHSVFGSQPVFKVGYVIKNDEYSYKLTWGESFQEPTARLLYGGWQGAGSAPDLTPEESNTWEASWNYITEQTRLTLALVEVKTKQTITVFPGGASNNPGTLKLRSLDLISQKTFLWPTVKATAWFNYSHVFDIYAVRRADTLAQSIEQNHSTGPDGNIARNKVMFGVELRFSDAFSTTLANRYISKRYTNALNPISSISGYLVSDLNLRWPQLLAGMDLNLQITNVFDKVYFHPGINTGNAGNQPGHFNADDVWVGSDGFFNSLLPQAGRGIFIGLDVHF
ncbi:MAG: outer membrane receptor for ferrienterochelin and colicins [Phenylobacterium sp.]|jgi:outer membrane receptor for ferrienterochelin and colicins